jgi:hypothetical protein
MLRSYVEPDQIGRFFGLLRSGWHVTLIAYFLAARGWIAAHPGSLAPLFAVGTAAGLLRIALIARLPERSERTGQPLRVREALALLRTNPPLRRYLTGVGGQGALWTGTVPFVIVLMRRVLGLSEAQVLLATVAAYAGGLASLYAWGRVVDRVGPARVFRWTSLGLAGTVLALLAVREPGPFAAVWLTGFFFVAAVLRAGFGVADTHVLFQLAPDHAPPRRSTPSCSSRFAGSDARRRDSLRRRRTPMQIDLGGAPCGPLAGVRVLDVSTVVSGPLCGQILGDLGADVVKLEPPEGDTTRRLGPPFKGGLTPLFAHCNRNKRAISVDLKGDEGRAVAQRLARASDVLIQNFRPGVAERLGIGYDELAAANPRLVYVAVSGFGPDGPYAEQPAYDMVIQALSGLAHSQ